MTIDRCHVTRLAPSPTGALHLGNARTFLVNWLLGRQHGWRIVMRVEDLDGPRVKPWATEQMLDELRWLGLDWDGPVVHQSQRGEAYAAALQRLVDVGAAYPCACSRKDIESAASAPHADGDAPTYPGTCRARFDALRTEGGPLSVPDITARLTAETDRPIAWRVRTDDAPITVPDAFVGPRTFRLSDIGGDFVIHKSDGLAAYQLAVVLDDAESGVDAIVRGDDLLDSGARQIHLRRLLGLGPEPTYWHLPLVVGEDGRRLAKRHGDTRIDHYRQRGTTPQRLLGLLGYWCGVYAQRREATLEELLARFALTRLPHTPIVFSPEDDAFLRGD